MNWFTDPISEQGGGVNLEYLLRMEEVHNHLQNEVLPNLTTPFLMMIPGEDILSDNACTRRFVNESPAEVKELIVHEDADHFPLCDKEFANQVFDAAAAFYD